MDINSLTFGAEFEVLLPEGHDHRRAVRELQALGHTVDLGSSMGRRTNFKVVHDGSVGAHRRLGAEFVSPVLQGDEGLERIARFAQALADYGAGINTTCGFHVHVGGFGAQGVSFFKNLVKLYDKFQGALDTVHPVSRRANNYCQSIRVNQTRLNAATRLREIIDATHTNGRYSKLNLLAYDEHNTVEFRQHAGTVDSVKVVNWIKTCLRIVAAAANGKTGEGNGAPVDFSRFTGKTRAVAEMVTRPQGATIAEVIEGRGWSIVSIVRHSRIAGLQVRAVKEGNRDRYFAEVTVTATVPATLEGLAQVIELADDEAAYLAGRAAQFAAA